MPQILLDCSLGLFHIKEISGPCSWYGWFDFNSKLEHVLVSEVPGKLL